MKNKTIQSITTQTITDVTTMHVETVVLDDETLDASMDFHHGFKLFYSYEWELLYGYYWTQDLVPNKDKRYYKEEPLTPGELRSVVQWLTGEEQTSQIVREYQIKFPKNPKKGVMVDL